MNVSGLGSTSLTNSGGSNAPAPTDQMGKDSFLKLLVAQLTHQSPTDPTDGTAFVAQLAQFSELEQLAQVNENLGTLQATQVGIVSNQAVSYLGKDVTFIGNEINHTKDGFSPVSFSLAGQAKTVNITVKDENGKEIAKLTASGKVGPQTVIWNGNDDDSEAAPTGRYTYSIEAFDDQGNAVGATSFGRGRVDGISFQSGFPELLIGNRRLAPADILEVNG